VALEGSTIKKYSGIESVWWPWNEVLGLNQREDCATISRFLGIYWHVQARV
jgi:hypothetical protein